VTAARPGPPRLDETLPDPVGERPVGEPGPDELEIDELWPVSRGPHLPDALGVLPGLARVFILLALARLVWGIQQAYFGLAPDPSLVAQFVLFVIPSIVSILLPAALLARHRDAFTRARTLLIGTFLLAVVEGLVVLRQPLEPILEQLTPASDNGLAFVSPGVIAYGVLIDVVSAFGLIAIAAGFGRTRQYRDADRTRMAVLLIVAAGLAAAAGRIIVFGQQAFSDPEISPSVAAYLSTGLVLGIVGVGAVAYVAIELVRGALAGEAPRLAWRLAALGAGLIVLASALDTAIVLWPAEPGQTGFSPGEYLILASESIGWLGLLSGLVLGLPALGEAAEGDAVGEPDEPAEP
jgi:hypothetical protein